AAVDSLCTRGVVLDRGRVVFDGTQSAAIDAYAESRTVGTNDLRGRSDRRGSGEVRVTRLQLRNAAGQSLAITRSGAPVEIALYSERGALGTVATLAV